MRTFFAAAIVSVLSLCPSLFAASAASLEAPSGSASRNFEFSYTATIEKVPEGAKSVDLWIPVARKTPCIKPITNLKFSAPVQPELAIEPELNNKMAHWKIDAAKAKGLSVTMSFDCVRQEIAAANIDQARELTGDEIAALAPISEAQQIGAGRRRL